MKFPFWRGISARRDIEHARDRVYRMAYAWCHDATLADDLTQATLEKALRRSSQLKDDARVLPWMMTILANAFRDHLRARREAVDLEEFADTLASGEPTPEEAWQSQDVVRRVRREIARLPAGHRQVVTLVDIEGCSYSEVGEILAIPVGTVMSRLCRARQTLRQRLHALAPVRERAQDKLRVVK